MLQSVLQKFKQGSAKKVIERCQETFHSSFFSNIEIDGWGSRSADYLDIYQWFTYYYHNMLPPIFQLHRQYFNTENRGFGEDAFHALWFLLFKQYKPAKILEIGVYRGQTLSYFNLLARYFNYAAEVHGISPLDDSGDSYSGYKKINYQEDIAANFAVFNLGKPVLHKGYSNDPAMIAVIQSKTWDLIYIDGSHDYEVVISDIETCLGSLKTNGLLVLDDSSLYLDYATPKGTFKGHPGPSKASDELKTSGRCINLINVGHNRVFIKV